MREHGPAVTLTPAVHLTSGQCAEALPTAGSATRTEAWQLPPHQVTTFGPRGARYATIIPVWNEGQRLVRQLGEIARTPHVSDIFIADTHSTDGSTAPDALRALGVRALIEVGERGVSLALRPALAHAILDGYDGVILMDGNGKDDPAMLGAFARALDAGADYAQGSRYIPGGQGVNTPTRRDVLIRYVHSPIYSLICGRRFTDSTIGSRAFSTRFLLDPQVRPFRDLFRYYDLYFYLGWSACRLGYRVADVPVTRTYPREGPIPTKITLRRGYWHMIAPLLAIPLGRYR